MTRRLARRIVTRATPTQLPSWSAGFTCPAEIDRDSRSGAAALTVAALNHRPLAAAAV